MRASACLDFGELGQVARHERDVLRGHRVGDRPVVGLLHPVAQADEPRVVLRRAAARRRRPAARAARVRSAARARRAGGGKRRRRRSFIAAHYRPAARATRIRPPVAHDRRRAPRDLNRPRSHPDWRCRAGAKRPRSGPARPLINRSRGANHGQSADLRSVRRRRQSRRCSAASSARSAATAHAPPGVRVDVTENDKGYVVHAEIPGVAEGRDPGRRSKATR